MRWLPWALGALILSISVLAYAGAIPPAMIHVRGLDKVGHFLLFGGFAAAGVARARQAERGGRARAIGWALAVLVLAGVDELAQGLSPSRSSDPYDFAADAAGIAVLSVVAWVVAAGRSKVSRAKGYVDGEDAAAPS